MPIPIDRDDVCRLTAQGAQLVDALPREDYEDSHLPNAISIPLKELDASTAARLRRDVPVITYCADFT